MNRRYQALASEDLGFEAGTLLVERPFIPEMRPSSGHKIVDDRQLLVELDMSDSDAAAILGRSRQALHQKLGSSKGTRKGAAGSSKYFKVSDIYTLTSAARQLGIPFRSEAVLDYVGRTRKEREPEAYALLYRLLRQVTQPLDVAAASAVLMVLPGFAEMLVRFDHVGDFLLDIIESARERSDSAEVFVVGPTSMQANIAGDWLGVAEDRCFGHDLADLLSPTLIVFAAGDQRVYTLNDKGEFMGAPEFQKATIARNALALLPSEMRTLASAKGEARSRRRG